MKRSILALLLCLTPLFAKADRWDSAVSKNAGHYAETYSVTVTTYTATEVIDDAKAIRSSVIDVMVNNAYVLWVGSNTTTLESTGFPIRSSSTYTTDGTFTGSLYGMAEPSAGGSVNVRVIYWLKNDALR